jgi:hypothetical protein
MNKQEFHAELNKVEIQHKDWRPFQCQGHPFDAQIFIIGINPATPNLSHQWLRVIGLGIISRNS